MLYQQYPLFLIGFMGSGKSTLGRHLARELGWTFIDLDDFIETRENASITRLFAAHGENGFREMERRALAEVVKMQKVVVATGGGTPCFFNNMELMNRAGTTLYLQLSPAALVRRLLPGQAHRPLIADKTPDELLQFITQKLKEREPWYQQAKITADAELLSPEAYVHILKEAL